jgi:hypothetical protein
MRNALALALALVAPPVAFAQAGQQPEGQGQAREEAGRLLSEAEAHTDAGRHALAARTYLSMYEVMRSGGLPRAPIALYSAGRALAQVPGREREAREVLQRFLNESTTLTEDPQVRDWRSSALEQITELEARLPSQSEPDEQAGGGPSGTTQAQPTTTTTSPWGPITLGVGLATLATAGVLGALALVKESDLTTRCGGTRCLDTPEHRGLYEDMRLLGGATDVLLVVGGLLAAGGLVLTLTLTEPSDQAPRAQAILRPGGAELALEGNF